MGAQTKGDTAYPRQRQLFNEGMRRENPLFNQQRPQEQDVGIGNYERQQLTQRAENTPAPGSGIAFGPGRSNRGDVDLRSLLQDRMTRGN
jgi:hypothetical protein